MYAHPNQRLCSPSPLHVLLIPAYLSVSFQVNLAFLCVQYGILAVAVLLLLVCTYAYVCSAPTLPRRRPLKHAWLHPLFALLTFGANLTMLVSKEIVADTAVKVGDTKTSYQSWPTEVCDLSAKLLILASATLQIARSTGHPTVYQFLDNNLDMVAITTLLAIGRPPSIHVASTGPCRM